MNFELTQNRGRKGWWVLFALLAGIIFNLSSKGGTPVPTPHPIDWIAHFGAYLALGFCAGKATGNWKVAWVVVAWFGALDELHQAFVPPREAGIVDWWFDLAGGGLGAVLAFARKPLQAAPPLSVPAPMPVLDVSFDD